MIESTPRNSYFNIQSWNHRFRLDFFLCFSHRLQINGLPAGNAEEPFLCITALLFPHKKNTPTHVKPSKIVKKMILTIVTRVIRGFIFSGK